MLIINPKYDGRSNDQYFMPEPSIILENMEDVREAIADPSWKDMRHPFPYRVKSLWLIGLIAEIAKQMFPYNADVHRLAREHLGLPSLSEAENAKEGTPLSKLIYNAQNYRRSDELINAGFRPLDDDMLKSASERKRKIVISDGTKCPVRECNGKLYAFKPRKRRLALLQGVPAKVE